MMLCACTVKPNNNEIVNKNREKDCFIGYDLVDLFGVFQNRLNIIFDPGRTWFFYPTYVLSEYLHKGYHINIH